MKVAEPFDVAVVGGGVVGCAVARRFALEGARVVLVEKGADILSGASKANSAILHTGFDAPPGSLELACMQAGYDEYLAIHERLNLPLLGAGAILAAWTREEDDKLDAIAAQAHANGVADVRRVDASELRRREPHLATHLRGGLLIPGEQIIDPWSAPLAYLTQAVAHGAEVRLGEDVTGGAFRDGVWRLDTTRGRIDARMTINCAGLFGDRLDEALLGAADFSISPRKGQFVVFDKEAAQYLDAILLPVPTERTKGVVVCRTIFGNVLVGPTAEDQDDRVRATVDSAALAALIAKAAEMLPPLEGMPVTAVYAGLRPATERKDYRIRHDVARRWITVGGIRSTGLTAALGLARHVYDLYAQDGSRHAPVADPIWPAAPNLAEHRPRDWETPGYGEIICHCELVTRREIEAALAGALRANDIGGLKRRTRAGMGRCQGFNCHAKLAALTRGRFAAPLAVDGAHG